MKNLGFLFAVCLMMLASCKSDGTTTAATDAATPAVPASATNMPLTPTDSPLDAAEAVPVGPITSIEFEAPEFDFGTANEGEKVEHIYKFTNTGNEPLIISNAKATCGCTVPQWPREPIAPGDSGEMKVVFDTKNKGKVGGQLQTKRVTITANTDPVNSYVNIKGTVNRSAAQQAEKDAAKKPG